jgi:transposase
MVHQRGSTLMDLPGIGPVLAARILAAVGDVARFADRTRFASWTGTAPVGRLIRGADQAPTIAGG